MTSPCAPAQPVADAWRATVAALLSTADQIDEADAQTERTHTHPPLTALSALPAVLLQSLMHSLRAKEILSLARCSKWTLQCADSAFAWRDCPPLEFYWYEDSLALLARSRFSRWLPISLVREDDGLSEVGATRLLDLMRSCPRIIRLGWYRWDLPVERGLQLLSHPSMQQVRNIGLYLSMPAEWVAAVASLPCLAELHLICARLQSSELLPLVHARALRTLSVSEWHCECLSAVMQLTQLRTLSIRAPRIDGGKFLAFCSALSALEELQLLSWDRELVRSICPADLAAGFASLRSLRTLRFRYTFDEESLAPALHHAPALRALTLVALSVGDAPTLLAQLSLANPLLEIQFADQREREAFEGAKQALRPMCA